jgi:D-alanyl-D-alanine carboxypeptidase (penicillin-binding protein 5/6)
MVSPCAFHRPLRTTLGALMIAALAMICGPAFGDGAAPPNVTAKSVFAVDADTGQTLYRKNADKQFRTLSITKLITAYVLMQRMGGQLSDKVTITPGDLVRGSSAGLKNGDVWTLQDLLYGMLLVSGNDAAMAIARHVGAAMLKQERKRGDPIKRFVKEMNAAAARLGAKHTRFADPYGLSQWNVSTARDIALIDSTVFRDPDLLPFWRCAQRVLSIGGPHARTFTLVSTIEMIGGKDILGAKTGSYFSRGLYHLVVGWRAPNGQTIVAVVLDSASHSARYDDMRTILAALPQDFPALAERPTASVSASRDGGNCR